MPRQTLHEHLASREETNRVKAEFLKVDLQTALTFLKVANQTSSDTQKQSSCKAARHAYDAMSNMASKVDFTAADRRTIESGLAHIKTELLALGEIF